ncbi:MAG: hypothetical protein B6I19_10260 [Bacteroidetes bacterium 4572_114]|nr:MAG: hypothetical protein B6I19_10260 [Bacteroidetes bacterium 4572_114]
MYVNYGSGQEGVLFWGLSPSDNNTQINNYKAAYGITNPCAGTQGGGPAALNVVIDGQNFNGYPTFCIICPDKTLYFNICYPPSQACFDPYFEMCGPGLSVIPLSRIVQAPKVSTTFDVSSSDDWTVTENVPWLSVLPASGTGNKMLKVNCEENASGSTRSGNITITESGSLQSQVVTVAQLSYPTHSISLTSGWNSLSSYIMPANNHIADVFDQVSGSFVIATTLTDVYYPSGPLNTIIYWEHQSAYRVKMDAPASLQIIGPPETRKTLTLSAGWSLIPIVCNYPLDAATALGSLDLEVAKDVVGTGVLWPDMEINTLGDLNPGMAYYVLLNSGGSITFPYNSDQVVVVDPIAVELPENPWTDKILSSPSHLIIIWADGLQGIVAGDIIGVFSPDNNCYGVATIFGNGQNSLVTVYSDDMSTAEKDGFSPGEAFSFKLYRPGTQEIFELHARFDEGQPNKGYFANNGLSVVSRLWQSAIQLH